MLEIKLIIFDLDGTLVDSRKGIVKGVNHTLKNLNIKEKDFNEIVSYIGTGVEDLIRKSLGKDNQGIVDKGLEIFTQYYKEHSEDESKLYPNVKEALDYFKNKDMVILTNRRKNLAEITLRHFGIDRYFKDIIGGSDDGCLKPSACPVERIFKSFTVDKKKSIMVGDMDLDVLAGKEAGVNTCAVTYGIGKREDLVEARPDFIIDDLLELKNIIE